MAYNPPIPPSGMQTLIAMLEQADKNKRLDQEMKLREMEFARGGQNADLQRTLMEQQVQGLQNTNEESNFIKNMLFGGQANMPGQGMSSPATQSTTQAMDILPPQEAPNLQAPPKNLSLRPANQVGPQSVNGVTAPQGPNLEALKNSPWGRMIAKKHFGFDPAAPAPETPEQKQAAALELFKQKEAIKNAAKGGGDKPTNTILTEAQRGLRGIKGIMPILDNLINDKNLPGIFTISPGKIAKYDSKTAGAIDTLVSAQSLPKIAESIELAKKQLMRKPAETVYDYQQRLKELKQHLLTIKKDYDDTINSNKVNTDNDDEASGMSNEELLKIAGAG